MKKIRISTVLRTAFVLATGLGSAMGDGPMVPPGAPPVPPAKLQNLTDFSDIQNQEAAIFLYTRKLMGAEKLDDKYYFFPKKPANLPAIVSAVQKLLPNFHFEGAAMSRDEAAGAIYAAMAEQGLILLEESIHCTQYTVPAGALMTARPGKQVTLTVDGIETPIDPGRTYYGDVRFTVADTYEITHMFDVYESRTGLCIRSNTQDSASVPASILDGTITTTEATDLKLNSQNDYFNPIVIDSPSPYTLKNPQLIMNGHGGDDFAGYGAGIMVTGDSQVVIDGGRIDTCGSIRTAIWLGGHSKTLVKNMTIVGQDGPTTDFPVAVMNEVPWPLGLKGNLRTTNLLEWADGTYLNCDVSCQNWGVMSTDGSWRGSKLTCINTTATITGESGYGAYCDMGVEDYFYGSTLNVPDYGVVIGGGFCGSTFGPSSRENTGVLYEEIPEDRRDVATVIHAGKNAVMIHSNQGGHCTLEPGTQFHSGRACILVKSKYEKEVTTKIECNGALLRSDNGILFQLMESDDAGTPSAEGFLIPEVCPVAHGLDVTDPDAPNTLHAYFNDMDLEGSVYNSHWTGGQNLCIHGSHIHIRGNVSAAKEHHVNVAPGGHITKETYYEIGNIAVDPVPVSTSGVILILSDGSTWTPTDKSYLSRLELGADCTLYGTLIVDGAPVQPEPGQIYCGNIQVSP